MRFDGKMSARRRQETIARFSVPIEAFSALAPPLSQATAPPSSQPTEPASSQRSTRRSRSTKSMIVESIDDDKDDDFVMGGGQVDDDDDFIDDDDDDAAPARTQPKKGKGKGKANTNAKGKGKKKASLPNPSYPEFDGPNPRVMLISLKAGALGLNLTVANNVYL